MKTPAPQATSTSQEPLTILAELARLFGRQAAKEFVEVELADPHITINKDEGARDD